MVKLKTVPKKLIGALPSTHGTNYETSVTLFTALSAALDFDEFEIYTNVKDWEPLDDIFLDGCKNGEKTLYLVQLKHVLKSKKLLDGFFIKGKDPNSEPKFDLKRYNDKYIELSGTLGSNNINFIFYTNYELNDKCSLLFVKNENEKNTFIKSLNTSIAQQSFSLNKSNKELTSFNENFIKHSNFLTNQQNVQNINKLIVKLLMRFKIGKDLSDLVIVKLIHYFDNIFSEKIDRPVITKSLTLKLLYFSCLYCRSINISDALNRNSNFAYSPHLWNYLKENMIVINKDQLDSVLNTISNQDYSIHEDNLIYVNIIFKDKTLKFKEKYFIQCCCSIFPFLIETKYHLEINNILNYYEKINKDLSNFNQFQVIFIDENNDENIKTKFNNASLELCDEIFKMKICFQNRKECFVKDIFKSRDELKLMLNKVNVSDFLEICKIDQFIDEIKTVELDRFVNWLKVKNSLDDLLKNDTVVLINCNYSRSDLINCFELKVSEKLINLLHETRAFERNEKILVLNDDYYNKLNINIIKRDYKNVHFLKIDQNNSLFWVNTFGSFENIEFEETDNDILELKSIPEIFKFNKLIAFCGIPGIGKTVAMNQLSTFFPSDIYILLIKKLSEKQDILDNLDDSISCLEKLRLLSNQVCKFHSQIFEHKFEKRDICVIFDGYDEVAPEFVKTTNILINSILEKDIQVILTSRTVLKSKIEQEFSTKSLSLKPFDLPEQSQYLEQYFSLNSKFDKYYIENMCAGIITNIKTNSIGDLKFNSVPLHLKIICDLIKLNNFNVSSIQVDKIKIYKIFIDSKIKVFKEKTKNINLDIIDIKEYHQYFALNQIFPAFVDSIMQKILEKLSQKLKRGSEKVGLLLDDVIEIFIHRTIAEYYTASWLVDNWENNKICQEIIVNEIFERKNYLVYSCFNWILYNETSVYKKIISNNFNEITSDEINQKYLLNRNILHLLILNLDLDIKSKVISSNLEKFFKNKYFEQIDLDYKDYFQSTPFDYSRKLVQETELIITIKVQNTNLYFYFNQNFNLLEFFSCKNFKIDNPEFTFKNGFDLFRFTIDKVNLLKFNFIFLMENDVCSFEDYKIGFEWLIECGESINVLHYKAMKINSLQLSYFLFENYENNDFFKNLDINPLSYAFSNNLFSFIKLFIENETVRSNYEKIIYVLKKFINDIISNNNEELIHYLLNSNFKLNELKIYKNVEQNREILEIYKNLLINEINDKIGNTILHLIILNKNDVKYSQNEIHHTNLLKLLKNVIEIQQNNINTKNKNGETPLYLAIQKNDVETVKILVNHKIKANINFENNPQKSYLHCSISSNNSEIMTLLLGKETNLEFADINGDTLLTCAVKNQNLNSVKMLLNIGAKINAINKNQETPLHCSVSRKKSEITKFLIDNNANVEAVDINGDTPLICAVDNENIEAVNILLHFGVEINTSNKIHLSALHKAVLKREFEIITILLDKEADIEASDDNGNTPLLLAISNENLGAIQILLNFKANINARNNKYESSLHLAVQRKELAITKTLLEKNAPIEALDIDGETPLIGAVRIENLEAVKVLISSGADFNKCNYHRSFPLTLAIELNKEIAITKFLLENGADVESRDVNENTPLFYAVFVPNLERLELLIQFGAKIDVQNKNLKSPLYIAIENNLLDITRFLLEKNARLDVFDENGKISASLAVKIKCETYDLLCSFTLTSKDIQQ